MPLPPQKLLVFDLDGTLAPSKSSIEPEIADLVMRLLEKKKVAIISGGTYSQFETQFLMAMPRSAEQFTNLYLLPASGTRLYTWRGTWCEQYSNQLMQTEKEKIIAALNASLVAAHYEKPAVTYGPLIEDRGSQITFSAYGQRAPITVKDAWDPTREKREKIAENLRKQLSGFDVRLGGMTSIDITRRGINKAYGIRKLEQYAKISPEDIIFVGDALFYGGNDYPVKATGVDCISVKDPGETKILLQSWLDLPVSVKPVENNATVN